MRVICRAGKWTEITVSVLQVDKTVYVSCLCSMVHLIVRVLLLCISLS